jgi:outer membrane immunogenic protein
MRRYIGMALALVFSLGLGGVAWAADMPVKAMPLKQVPVPIYNWTGFYVGLNAGFVWFDKDWAVPLTPFNITGGCPRCPTTAGGHSANNWLAGGQVGFNYQIDRVVLGVEAQADWTKLQASNASLFAGPAFTDNSKTDGVGTIAARLGYTWDRALLYVKGGGAWAHDKFWTSTARFPVQQSVSDTRLGWMVGVGGEYALSGNWSVKVEYDHMDFGRHREELACISAGCFQGFDFDVKQTVDLVKVGVNYRFDFASPVVAKY